jgi:hypothetical protein
MNGNTNPWGRYTMNASGTPNILQTLTDIGYNYREHRIDRGDEDLEKFLRDNRDPAALQVRHTAMYFFWNNRRRNPAGFFNTKICKAAYYSAEIDQIKIMKDLENSFFIISDVREKILVCLKVSSLWPITKITLPLIGQRRTEWIEREKRKIRDYDPNYRNIPIEVEMSTPNGSGAPHLRVEKNSHLVLRFDEVFSYES